MQGSEYGMQAVFGAWYRDKMNMVSHQAIGENLHTVFFTILFQPGEIGPSILIRKEDILATVTALREVMGDPGENGSRDPWHSAA